MRGGDAAIERRHLQWSLVRTPDVIPEASVPRLLPSGSFAPSADCPSSSRCAGKAVRRSSVLVVVRARALVFVIAQRLREPRRHKGLAQPNTQDVGPRELFGS